MYEILAKIIDKLMTGLSISKILKYRKQKKLNKVGVGLYSLYSAMNEVLGTGRLILAHLEWACGRAEEGRDYFGDIEFYLTQQQINILRLVEAISSLGLTLHVIDAEVYVQLIPLIHGKTALLEQIVVSLGTRFDKNPRFIVFSEDELDALMMEGAELWADMTKAQSPKDKSDSFLRLVAGRNVFYDVRFGSLRHPKARVLLETRQLFSKSKFTPKRILGLKKYLDSREPEKCLKRIEDASQHLRKSLQKHFKIADILTDIGAPERTLRDRSTFT